MFTQLKNFSQERKVILWHCYWLKKAGIVTPVFSFVKCRPPPEKIPLVVFWAPNEAINYYSWESGCRKISGAQVYSVSTLHYQCQSVRQSVHSVTLPVPKCSLKCPVWHSSAKMFRLKGHSVTLYTYAKVFDEVFSTTLSESKCSSKCSSKNPVSHYRQ